MPHLHGVVWVPDGDRTICPSWVIKQHWLAVAEPYGVTMRGQHIAPITDMVGWLKYLAKHAARGVAHYQRSPESVPPAWAGATGRVWGHTGDWPLGPVVKLHLDDAGFFKLRRLCRRWRIADARERYEEKRLRMLNQWPAAETLPRRSQTRLAGVGAARVITSARSMLTCPERPLSSVRGVSEWIPQDVTDAAVSWLAAEGHAVHC